MLRSRKDQRVDIIIISQVIHQYWLFWELVPVDTLVVATCPPFLSKNTTKICFGNCVGGYTGGGYLSPIFFQEHNKKLFWESYRWIHWWWLPVPHFFQKHNKKIVLGIVSVDTLVVATFPPFLSKNTTKNCFGNCIGRYTWIIWQQKKNDITDYTSNKLTNSIYKMIDSWCYIQLPLFRLVYIRKAHDHVS